MGNGFSTYVSLADRLAQSEQDRANNLSAMGLNNMPTYSDYLRVDSTMYRDLMMYGNAFSTTTYSSGNGKSEKEKNAVGLKVLTKIKAAAKVMTVTEKDGENAISKADEYRALGLDTMARVVEMKSNRILREMGIAAAGYKRINRSELNAFQKELDQISDSSSKRRLSETPLARYVGQNNQVTEGSAVLEMDLGVPPQDVLDKLKVARESKLFDDYAVLHIQYVPDPILCGKINESNDLYFIAEWGDDVKLSDIVKE